MHYLKGKTVLITGANRGIGLAFVKEAIAQGVATIYAAGRDKNALNEVAKLNENITPMLLDVTNAEQIKTAFETLSELDVLINNAGIAHGCFHLNENAISVARQEMETHYFGPLQIIQNAVPLLKQSQQAAIINIASAAALSNFPSLGPYSVTKAALKSLSEGLRVELAPTNITVHCVYPGPTDTRLAPGDIPKATTESIAQNTLAAVANKELDIYPDSFAKTMFEIYSESPEKLAQTYAGMHSG